MPLKRGQTSKLSVFLVDETDEKTPESGVVSPTIVVSKNGGDFITGTGTFAETDAVDAPGDYTYQPAVGEVDTIGPLRFNVVKTGVTAIFRGLTSVEEDVGGGFGAVGVDHNFGGLDALRVTDNVGAGISGVNIQAYLKTDYENGNRVSNFVKGQATTGTDGRWLSTIALDPGTYILQFEKVGVFQTNTFQITVT